MRMISSGHALTQGLRTAAMALGCRRSGVGIEDQEGFRLARIHPPTTARWSADVVALMFCRLRPANFLIILIKKDSGKPLKSDPKQSLRQEALLRNKDLLIKGRHPENLQRPAAK